MSSQADEPITPAVDSLKQERGWRAEQFLSLGFALPVATIMAKRRDISWHVAKQLRDAGATVEQCEQILL